MRILAFVRAGQSDFLTFLQELPLKIGRMPSLLTAFANPQPSIHD